MPQSKFVYDTYIRASVEDVWTALTDAASMKRYWFGMHCECAWTTGAPWTRFGPDGNVIDSGEIVAVEPPHRLVIRWRHHKVPALSVEGESLCTMNLEGIGSAVKLSITHTIEREPSALIAAVSEGWPKVVSNLKSFIETDAILLATA